MKRKTFREEQGSVGELQIAMKFLIETLFTTTNNSSEFASLESTDRHLLKSLTVKRQNRTQHQVILKMAKKTHSRDGQVAMFLEEL